MRQHLLRSALAFLATAPLITACTSIRPLTFEEARYLAANTRLTPSEAELANQVFTLFYRPEADTWFTPDELRRIMMMSREEGIMAVESLKRKQAEKIESVKRQFRDELVQRRRDEIWSLYRNQTPVVEDHSTYDQYRQVLELVGGIVALSNGAPRSNQISNGHTVYSADECIGPVIMGVCHGSILPKGGHHETCYGAMLNGKCTGPQF
jgi:hypothetical protein